MQRWQLASPRTTTFLLGAAALSLVVSIIVFPAEAFTASLKGLNLWWKLVFPALLPFLILTELMRGLGLLHAVGVLLEPLLRTLFRLPGAGGWAMALGFTAGMPAGASAVSLLRREGLVTREEGERLLSVSHLMSPVFLIGIIGAGFLHDPTAGLALASLHYAAALILALLHRFRSKGEPLTARAGSGGLFRRSADACRDAVVRDGRTFGKLLGDSVTASIQQLFVIGGCMMMFSVLLQVVSLSNLVPALGRAASMLGLSGADLASLLASLLPGVFEPHLGAFAIVQHPAWLADPWCYALLSLLLGWGGFSAHAQVKSLTAATDLRFGGFLLSRLAHGGIASLLTLIAWEPLNAWLGGTEQAARAAFLPGLGTGWSATRDSLWPLVSPMMLQFGTVLLLLLVLSVFAAFLFYRHRKSPDS
ncbi:sporulation protein [Paenibacillus filicis]|uniref:Sporulation protein n=1 Tax=Paenibacillus gyeongsangnamensis TaxID=3388067 RepID=A0ABT4Q6G7_9BACL|nr:nucleoside recognition domain-containing protein [Paenibacillus filicis]MCZ8512469.1 sporulation protein [Paenibacillus filicis]